jgi:hypothetical protein
MKPSDRARIALVAIALLLVACYSAETGQLECPTPDTAVEDTAKPDVVTDIAEFDGELREIHDGPGSAGAACEANGDCDGIPEGALCLTPTFASMMFDVTVEIPGNMCTKIGCDAVIDPEGSCGEGGHCVGVSMVTGNPADTDTLCVHPCDADGHCRLSEDFHCYTTGVPDQIKACLPQGIIDLIPCGNGKCEENESETAETCPRDCA